MMVPMIAPTWTKAARGLNRSVSATVKIRMKANTANDSSTGRRARNGV